MDLNQNEFSNLIGISQSTLSELEKDKYNPSIEITLTT
ncbi:helix-turn-helix transcriptional regulator [Paenibacillus alba]